MKSQNFISSTVSVISPAQANIEFAIEHNLLDPATGLGVVPRGYFVIRRNKGGVLYTSPPADLATSFIAGWEFENGGALGTDSGPNGLTLTNSGATQVAGKVGNATQYVAASSQYMSRASEALLQTGDIDFTFALWVQLTTKATFQAFVAKDAGTGTTPPREYAVYYDPTLDRFRINIFSSTVVQIVQSANGYGAVPTGTWLFVVAWHDSVANTLNIQVNDGAVSANSYGATVVGGATAAQFRVGARATAGNELYTNGKLDQVMFWKRTLNVAERTWLYNGGAGRTVADFSSPPTATPWTTSTAYLSSSIGNCAYNIVFFA